MDFEARVHRVATAADRTVRQQRLPADGGLLLPVRAPRAARAGLAAARCIRTYSAPPLNSVALADFIVVTSNFVHLISFGARAGGRLWNCWSMVDLALNEVARRAWHNVGVLGFGEPRVYTHRLPAMNVRSETIDGMPPRRGSMPPSTRSWKVVPAATRTTPPVTRSTRYALREVDGIVLGCTEIALLLGDTDKNAPDLIDPLRAVGRSGRRTCVTDRPNHVTQLSVGRVLRLARSDSLARVGAPQLTALPLRLDAGRRGSSGSRPVSVEA